MKLNVGGTLFHTTKTTLTSVPDSFFYAMLGGNWLPDPDGEYFIDRDAVHFPRILSYLRTGNLYLDDLSVVGRQELMTELDFYQLGVSVTHPQPETGTLIPASNITLQALSMKNEC